MPEILYYIIILTCNIFEANSGQHGISHAQKL